MLWFQRLNLTALALCFIVVVFGAYVRLSDAGLGCPDWPGCYGHLGVPDEAHEVTAAEARYPERPVEAPKAWKEMIHRYLASTLGLLIVAMAVMSLRLPQAPRLLPWALVGVVIFQGVLGMWTVTWQLKPLAVTAHLLGGMTTLAMLFWLYLRTRTSLLKPSPSWGSLDGGTRLRQFALLSLVVLTIQIFLGGWTSTNYAALACPDLPTCHGEWWPETDVGEAFTLWRGLGTNYEFGVLDNRARVTIHFIHRIGALVTTAVLLLLAWQLWRAQRTRLATAVAVALGLQVSIGISVVHWQLPLLLADAHNAGAALLLLTLVAVNHQVRT